MSINNNQEKTPYPVQPAPFAPPTQGYNAQPAPAFNQVYPVGIPHLTTSPQFMSILFKLSYNYAI